MLFTNITTANMGSRQRDPWIPTLPDDIDTTTGIISCTSHGLSTNDIICLRSDGSGTVNMPSIDSVAIPANYVPFYVKKVDDDHIQISRTLIS